MDWLGPLERKHYLEKISLMMCDPSVQYIYWIDYILTEA